ncbi:uncharacterized protein Fot_38356 [Forsythia ovata]|uniref:Uncharacterized protein n=1 Tax=Forsythia ovata TaxID=205694 RepID=A0ABD1S1K0_9LAMI
MPSGAKKRKAAKKKKEKESSSASTNSSNQPDSAVHSHGDDVLKHQDDKETDGGEVSSPASQDHNSHQQHFTEEEEEVEKGEDTSNFVFIEGVKNEGVKEQKMVAEEKSVVQVEKELKHEDESGKKDVMIEYDELAEKSYDGGVSGSSSSNSSSSSSDDESHGFEKNKDTVHDASVDLAKAADSLSERPSEVFHGALVEQAGNSVVQTCPVVGLEKVSLLNEEVQLNTGAPLDISETSPVLKENMEELKAADESFVFSAAGMDGAFDMEVVEATVQSAETAEATSDANECAAQGTDDKLTLSYSVAENEKDSGVPKPMVASTPRAVQTTSWKSCCGLFEILTGSER